ncbi:hypothetical protein J132_04383 [Termitomyces sp. J132]|nr:hypothetical protein J132_04383 [Termitomyces sp. J132]
MMPNFSPALMQQQQQTQQQQQQLNQQQQQPQQTQDSQQPFPDAGRMWQQMQQMPYNRPSGAGAFDSRLTDAVLLQMMDLIRNQNLARMQGMQHNQQQFPLGGQQVGNMSGGPGNNQPHIQNQSFLDSGSSPSQVPGFPPGMSNPGMQQQPPANRNAMLQALQGNNGHVRQLEMLLAQNQSGPINLAQRLEHQRVVQQQAQQLQSMGQSSPAELFASGAVDRHPSPGHPNISGPNPMGSTSGVNAQQQQQQPRRVSPAELNERIMALRSYIANQERTLAQLGSQRNLTSDGQTLGRMRGLSDDIKVKKEYLAKMVSAMNNFTAMTQAQAQQANGSGQSPWNFNTSSQLTPGQPPNAQQVGHTSIPQGHSSPLIRQQAQQLQQINRPSGLTGAVPRPPSVQRSHPPNPVQGPSLANQLSPNMNPQFPFAINSVNGPASSPLAGPTVLQPSLSGTMQLPPPLEKSRFDSSYKNFCATKGVKHDPRMINYEGRDIDLFILHTHVMQEGGFMKVASQDLWGVIGGRMGFVNFPASETEPAKAGPGLAQRLAQVYREYLAHFDQAYISSIMDSKRKMQALHQAQMAQTQAAAAAGNTNNALASNQPLRGALNGNQIQMVVGYAHQSVEELRRQGVQERIISFVETNRAYLQRTAMEQGIFRGQLSQGMRSAEQHSTSTTVSPFQNGSHQNAPSQHANFLSQSNGLPTSMSSNNFVDNRQPSIPQPQHPTMQNGSLVGQPKNIGEILHRIKVESRAHFMRNTRVVDVPIEQRAEFNLVLNQLFVAAQEIDKQLPSYLFVLKAEEIKKLALIILTVTQQRTLLNTASPRYIATLEFLRTMMQQIQQSTGHLRQHMGPSPQQPHHPAGNIPLNNLPVQEISRPSSSLPQQPVPLQSLAPPNRLPMNLRPPPVVKKPSGSTSNAAVSTPTPPSSYSASTPVPSASTPSQTVSSPPAPKSPKGRVSMKSKKRRPSVKRPPSTPAPPAIEQESTLPVPGGVSSKRLREEDVINAPEVSPGTSGSGVINEPSPPKRPKTEGEWGGPLNEAITKKAETVENIKTEEDTSAFLEQMTELIKMAGEGQQEALSSDISETLDQILKGYGSVPDDSDSLHGFSSFGSLGEPSSQASTSKPHPDEFVEFFDFSSFTAADEENDTDSKAPTPELSSTGPSPDSGSEADAAQHVALSMEPPKTEELSDLLRIGSWKEIDGGESAYYHTADGWKWDSPMPTLEQPWAIFNS